MKKGFLLIMLFCMAVKMANAQYLTANEIIEKTGCRALGCYQDFLSKKKFSFDEEKPLRDGVTLYVYKSNIGLEVNSNSNLRIHNYVTFNIKHEGGLYFSDICAIATGVKSYYQKLIAEFEKNGYRRISSDAKDGVVSMTYKSNKNPNGMLAITVENHDVNGETYNHYSITLYNPK